MKQFATFAALTFASVLAASAQTDEGNKLTLHGSIQSDVLVPQEDNRIGTGTYKDDVLTNTYAELHLMSKYVQAGARFEYLEHPLPGFENDFKGWGVPYMYLQGNYKWAEMTLGDFYDQFGSGLIFRTYEERSLGIDNSLRGGRLVLKPGKGYTAKEMKHTFPLIAADFANIPVTRVPKVKVGVVGEIYVKYSPLGNNDLQKFLESQDCEVNFPGLMGFVQYCAFNMGEDHVLYGGKLGTKVIIDQFLNYLDGIERSMLKATADAGFYAPGPFKELVEKPRGVISLGAKMGEGWLLTAEMIELVQGGYGNIVCAQPFGCLPNHIVGKGMVNKIRALYPASNITPIDYDPSATKVNQENRIKLMLAVAKERLNNPVQEPVKPLTAEELAGGAPRLNHEMANV